MFLEPALSFTPDQFKEYLSKLKKPTYAKAITLHHTAEPSLVQRPNGFSPQHLKNLQSYYKGLGWKSCPAIFTDDNYIHVLSDILKPGNHAVSFNSYAIGIEVLGNYDIEDPKLGRGLKCWKNAIQATQMLSEAFEIPLNTQTLLFHNDDPKTPKSCPGKKVTKEWIFELLNTNMAENKNKKKIPSEEIDKLSKNIEDTTEQIVKTAGVLAQIIGLVKSLLKIFKK